MATRFSWGLRAVAAAPSERSVVTQSDVTGSYLGMFRMPETVSSFDTGAGRGFCLHRFDDGVLRAFSSAYEVSIAHHIYQVTVPGSLGSSVGSSPIASVDRIWGYPASNGVNGIYNMFVDPASDPAEPDMFISGGDSYIDNGDFMCLARVKLNANGTLGASSNWRFAPGSVNRSSKYSMHGVTELPQWFQDAYCPGMRLAAGHGGYESLQAAGPASIGPSLVAFDPSNLPSSGGSITDSASLLAYAYNPVRYTSPTRPHRATDYDSEMGLPEFQPWQPNAGIGYWVEQDYIWGGGLVISTDTKQGYVVFAVPGKDRCYYEDSKLKAANSKHSVTIYDLDDLGRVAQGLDSDDTPQPVSFYDVQYSGLTYPLGAWADLPWKMIVGTARDPVTGRLYVSVMYGNGADPTPNPNVVHVYQGPV